MMLFEILFLIICREVTFVGLFCTNTIKFITKYFQVGFSQELSSKNEVISMNVKTLKGWPFESFGSFIGPDGPPGDPGGGGGNPL